MSEKLNDEQIQSLIARNYDAYLTWIGLWLVCLLAIVNMLIIVASTPQSFFTPSHMLLLVLMNIGLLVGMIEAVKRLSNLISNNILYARSIENKLLREEMTKYRGPLSLYFIDYQGQIRIWNRRLVYILHAVVMLFLFFLAML